MTFRTSDVVATTSHASIPQVDNFVDKSPREASRTVKSDPPRSAAQKKGSKILLNINDLQHNVAAARATSVRSASTGAAVERSLRASGRSVDG